MCGTVERGAGTRRWVPNLGAAGLGGLTPFEVDPWGIGGGGVLVPDGLVADGLVVLSQALHAIVSGLAVLCEDGCVCAWSMVGAVDLCIVDVADYFEEKHLGTYEFFGVSLLGLEHAGHRRLM